MDVVDITELNLLLLGLVLGVGRPGSRERHPPGGVGSIGLEKEDENEAGMALRFYGRPFAWGEPRWTCRRCGEKNRLPR